MELPVPGWGGEICHPKHAMWGSANLGNQCRHSHTQQGKGRPEMSCLAQVHIVGSWARDLTPSLRAVSPNQFHLGGVGLLMPEWRQKSGLWAEGQAVWSWALGQGSWACDCPLQPWTRSLAVEGQRSTLIPWLPVARGRRTPMPARPQKGPIRARSLHILIFVILAGLGQPVGM